MGTPHRSASHPEGKLEIIDPRYNKEKHKPSLALLTSKSSPIKGRSGAKHMAAAPAKKYVPVKMDRIFALSCLQIRLSLPCIGESPMGPAD